LYIDHDDSISSKQEFLANVKSEGLAPEQITNEQQTAHVFGDCAVVTGEYREKWMNKGKPYSRRTPDLYRVNSENDTAPESESEHPTAKKD
jgi:ketosteroid isomerase-like protein